MAGFQPGAFQPGAFQQGGTQSNGGPGGPGATTETLWGGGLRADGYASYVGGRYRYDKRKRKKPSTADLKMLLKAGYAIGQLRKKKRNDD